MVRGKESLKGECRREVTGRAKTGVCYKMRGGGVNRIIYNLYNNNKFITIIEKYSISIM